MSGWFITITLVDYITPLIERAIPAWHSRDLLLPCVAITSVMPTAGRSSPKYRMTQSELQQLARILSRNLPVDTEEATYVRAYYAGDGRVSDWEQRLADIVADSRVLSSAATIGGDWLIVAAVMGDRAGMVDFLDAVQELAPGQPGDPPLACLRADVG